MPSDTTTTLPSSNTESVSVAATTREACLFCLDAHVCYKHPFTPGRRSVNCFNRNSGCSSDLSSRDSSRCIDLSNLAVRTGPFQRNSLNALRNAIGDAYAAAFNTTDVPGVITAPLDTTRARSF